MKIKITTTIDLDLKEIFDSMVRIHHYGYQDALDRGIREILIELNQTQLVDQEISRERLEISRRSQRLTKLETVKEQLKNIEYKDSNLNKPNPLEELEKRREKALSGFLKKPYEEWTHLNKKVAIEDGKFRDENELETWVITKKRQTTI